MSGSALARQWRLACPACGAKWGAGCEVKAYQSADNHSRRSGENHKVRVTPPAPRAA